MIKKYSSAFARSEMVEKSNIKFDVVDHKFRGQKFYGHEGGFPLMYNSENKTLILDPSDNHQIILGATGSKKTRAIIMPTIKVLAYAGESMIIHDTKGELYARHSRELATLGYNIVTLSFRDPSVGNAWNPLAIPYIYYSQGDIDKANEFSNDVARSICMAKESNGDPYWQTAAADTLFGLLLLLMEYVKECNLPAAEVNIANLIKLKRELFNNKKSREPKNTDIWKWASENELIYAALSGTVLTANDTRAGVVSTLDSALRTFIINQTLTSMLSNNDVDIASIGAEKTAVFLITPDEKTSMLGIVSLFVQQSYQYLIYKAIERGGQIDIRINYILDEFSSLPVIGSTGDFVSMISAARSRNIRFLIACQSFGALKKRYGDEKDAIVANCTNMVFLFSRELELLKYLSELCGSKADGKPNITISELQQLDKESNQALLFNGRLKPALVNFLDIDKFDKIKSPVLLSKAQRDKVGNIDFSQLPDFAKKIIEKALNASRTPNPFESRKIEAVTEPTLENAISDGNSSTNESNEDDSLNLEQLMKELDKKIADLEYQEKLSQRIQERAKEIDSIKEG